MKQEREQLKGIDLFYSIVFFILCSIIITVNLFIGIPPSVVLLYGLGSISYIVFFIYSRIKPSYNTGHIQTGEASLAVLAIIICIRFITEKLLLIFIFVLFLFWMQPMGGDDKAKATLGGYCLIFNIKLD